MICWLLAGSAVTADDSTLLIRQRIDDQFRGALESLATKCEELGLQEQAQISRHWVLERDPRRQYIFPLSKLVEFSSGQPDEELIRLWRDRFRQLRRQYAAQLYGLARSEAEADRTAAAYQLLHEVLREDPDHAAARRILRWPRRPKRISARTQLRVDQRFQWPPGGHRRIESEHFQISTNLDRDVALRLVHRLEQLYEVWQQLFFTFWSNPAVLRRSLDRESPLPRPSRRQHKVVLFRDQNEYLAALSRYAPREIASQVAGTIGIYLYGSREAWFYGSPDQETGTWLHEVTHQLFHETTSGTAARVGGRNNFWIVEGIAMYLESLQDHGSYCTVGGFDTDRLQLARFQARHGSFYLPLEQLAAMGSAGIQRSASRIQPLYTQSAGMAHFLMNFKAGRYRPLVADYLNLVYTGRSGDNTLERLSGTPFPRLDAEYRQFLEVRDADLLHHLTSPEKIRRLVLGRTHVTDAGLAALTACSNLEALDLSLTDTSDAGLQYLAGLTNLTELGLAQTKITDQGLVHLRNLKQLETLDVRGTAVTDKALAGLQKSLPRLTPQSEPEPRGKSSQD